MNDNNIRRSETYENIGLRENLFHLYKHTITKTMKVKYTRILKVDRDEETFKISDPT